ncbi:MAG: SAF domain-containing protein [Mycobacterium sp.]|nr:SAF domain-containing protein [Mycobacterium sp.]
MGQSVNPTPLERLSRLAHPDFTQTALARRIAAGLLVALAGAAALRPDPGSDLQEIVVAAHDLGPGITLGAGDIALSRRPGATVPDGALTALDAAMGATLAGPSRRGEILTDARVLGSRQAELTAGPDARTVPVHLVESAVLDVIRPGDIVDVLGAPDGEARPRLVARDAVVVFISPGGEGRVVLLALPAAAASALAAASLVQSLTLTIH